MIKFNFKNSKLKGVFAVVPIALAGIMAVSEALAERQRDKDIEDLKKENQELQERVSELEQD